MSLMIVFISDATEVRKSHLAFGCLTILNGLLEYIELKNLQSFSLTILWIVYRTLPNKFWILGHLHNMFVVSYFLFAVPVGYLLFSLILLCSTLLETSIWKIFKMHQCNVHICESYEASFPYNIPLWIKLMLELRGLSIFMEHQAFIVVTIFASRNKFH